MKESKSRDRITLQQALSLAKEIIQLLKPLFSRLRVAGSIRRKKDTIGDIDLVGELKSNSSIADVYKLLNDNRIQVSGEKILNFTYKGVLVNLFVAPSESYHAFMMHATGPGKYNIAYRTKAKKLGYKLNQYGLWDKEGRLIATKERDIYKFLNKQWKPPSKRGESLARRFLCKFLSFEAMILQED